MVAAKTARGGGGVDCGEEIVGESAVVTVEEGDVGARGVGGNDGAAGWHRR